MIEILFHLYPKKCINCECADLSHTLDMMGNSDMGRVLEGSSGSHAVFALGSKPSRRSTTWQDFEHCCEYFYIEIALYIRL